MTQHELSDKQAGWVEYLSQYKYVVQHIPGKDLVVPDAISRRPDWIDDAPAASLMALSSATDRWRLRDEIFTEIDRDFGPFDFDACSQQDGSDSMLPA
jgi:hypothetical protein